jgi:hypothetical protein
MNFPEINVLLVEDSSSDALLLEDKLAEVSNARFRIVVQAPPLS